MSLARPRIAEDGDTPRKGPSKRGNEKEREYLVCYTYSCVDLNMDGEDRLGFDVVAPFVFSFGGDKKRKEAPPNRKPAST